MTPALSRPALQSAADEALAAWNSSSLVQPFSQRLPSFSLDDGYAVMERLHAHRLGLGWVPVGRKIGFTNTRIWDRYGVHHPIWGWVYDRTLLADGAAACSLASLVQPRIEPEIVVGLAAAPPADGDLEGVLASVAWVAHGFEIVQSHYPDWRFAAADSVAFGSLHGRLLVGPKVRPQDLGDSPRAVLRALESLEIRLGREVPWAEVDRGVGANVLGNPLAAISHLQALLARTDPARLMQAGEVVTTGTVTDAHAVASGETWSTRVAGIDLPGLRVTFTQT